MPLKCKKVHDAHINSLGIRYKFCAIECFTGLRFVVLLVFFFSKKKITYLISVKGYDKCSLPLKKNTRNLICKPVSNIPE